MKKTLFNAATIAISTLCISTLAAAQSSVTVFGVVDAGLAFVKNSGAGHAYGLVNGGNSTSRLGFRGTEDLGRGLSASFWLEGTLHNDVGGGAGQGSGLDFQRRATVSLSGTFGEIRLGRDFAASYPSVSTYDVTGNRGLGQIDMFAVAGAGISSANPYRVSNAVSYFLPATLDGFYGQLQYAFGEQNSRTTASAASAATDKTGNYLGSRFGYASGPLNITASYGQYADAVRTVGDASYADDYKVGNLGAWWDFGPLKLAGFMQRDQIAGRAAVASYKLDTYTLGATVPVGAGLLRTQVSHYDRRSGGDDANKISLGYVYKLSKRTALYSEVAHINNKGSANYALGGVGGLATAAPAAGGNSTGFSLGLKTEF